MASIKNGVITDKVEDPDKQIKRMARVLTEWYKERTKTVKGPIKSIAMVLQINIA